jgi:hypothetical protein
MLPEFVTKLLPPGVKSFLDAGGGWLVLGVLAVLVLWILYRKLAGGRTQDPEAALRENLADLPLPTSPWERELTVEGTAVRLMLVVVAPVGKQPDLDARAVETQLEELVRGMGDILRQDRPKVRVWPPQLSAEGFTTVFHRLTRKPEREGIPSPWVLLAGRTPVGRRKLLVGLAMLAEEPNRIGRLTLDPNEWTRALRVERSES